MRHPKSLAFSYKLLIINNSILSQQKSDEVGRPFFSYQKSKFSIAHSLHLKLICLDKIGACQ